MKDTVDICEDSLGIVKGGGGSGADSGRGRHLEETLVNVFLTDVEVDDVAVAQLTLLRLQEVKRRQAAADVVVGLLAQRQQRRHVRSDRLLPRNGHQALAQPADKSIQFNSTNSTDQIRRIASVLFQSHVRTRPG